MPATTPNPSKSNPRENGNGAPLYVKCDLTKEQKLALIDWAAALEWVDLWQWVDRMTADYRVISIKRIPDTVGFQVAITTQKGSGDEGKTLMARGSTATKALISAMYKDVAVLQGVWVAVSREVDLDL